MHDLLLRLYESLSPEQRAKVAFDWHYTHPVLGLLRRRVENDWRVTKPRLASNFYTSAQQAVLREIFFGLLDPAWRERFEFILSEDSGGYGEGQSMAMFGTPGETPLEIVITSRHLTLRHNTDAAEPCAFGGPIFYAHEGPHKNALETSTNVFWPQAVRATQLLKSLPTELQSQALSPESLPAEGHIDLANPLYAGDGLRIGDMPCAARERAGELFAELLAPFRREDRQRAHECVESLGGLEACRPHLLPGRRPARGRLSLLATAWPRAVVVLSRQTAHSRMGTHFQRSHGACQRRQQLRPVRLAFPQ